MVGTRDLARLLDAAEQAQAKLVLVGDDRQLPEIQAGGLFSALADRLGAIELTEVRRQREAWDRDALAALRDGDVEHFARAYHDHGRIVAAPSADAARAALVDDWWSATERGEQALMIAHRRADVADLNRRARERMRAAGRLGVDALVTPERAFAVGDRVVTTRNDRRLGVVNGETGTLTRIGDGDADRGARSRRTGRAARALRARRPARARLREHRPPRPGRHRRCARSCSAPTSSTANGATPRSRATATRPASTSPRRRPSSTQAPEPLRDADVPRRVARMLEASRAEHLALHGVSPGRAAAVAARADRAGRENVADVDAALERLGGQRARTRWYERGRRADIDRAIADAPHRARAMAGRARPAHRRAGRASRTSTSRQLWRARDPLARLDPAAELGRERCATARPEPRRRPRHGPRPMSALETPTLDAATIRAIAREVARLTVPGGGLLTASEVAVAFNVTRGWVYAHADELGAIRLGDGPRPRLRFDPAVVTQRLQQRRGRVSASPPSTPVGAGVVAAPDRPGAVEAYSRNAVGGTHGEAGDRRGHRARAQERPRLRAAFPRLRAPALRHARRRRGRLDAPEGRGRAAPRPGRRRARAVGARRRPRRGGAGRPDLPRVRVGVARGAPERAQGDHARRLHVAALQPPAAVLPPPPPAADHRGRGRPLPRPEGPRAGPLGRVDQQDDHPPRADPRRGRGARPDPAQPGPRQHPQPQAEGEAQAADLPRVGRADRRDDRRRHRARRQAAGAHRRAPRADRDARVRRPAHRRGDGAALAGRRPRQRQDLGRRRQDRGGHPARRHPARRCATSCSPTATPTPAPSRMRWCSRRRRAAAATRTTPASA